VADNEFEARRASVAEELVARKLDALAVGGGPNLRYLTGFTGSNGLLLLTPDDAVFFTDPRYRIQSAQEVSCRVQVSTGPLLPDLASAAGRRKVRRLGFEPGRTSYEAYQTLQAKLGLKVALEPVPGLIERQRMLKSPAEIEAIRTSVVTNSKAFEQALARIRPGMSESDLAAELEYRMRRLGAEKPAFETIVASGVRAALPHAQPTSAVIRNGELVLVDMGAMRDGYASDMTRMVFLGRPGHKVRSIHNAVLEAQLAAIDSVRAGVTTAHVHRVARRVLKAHGLDRAFVHSTGHGLGLEIHEPPRIGKRDKSRLEAGMTVTIEPGVYLEGFCGMRIEDTIVVTTAGCQVLTPTSKQLRVL